MCVCTFLNAAQYTTVASVLLDGIPDEIGEALDELNERVEYGPALEYVLHLIALNVRLPLVLDRLEQLLDAQEATPRAQTLQLDLGVAQLHDHHE